MGTKNNPGLFDCYANALPDEPLFILRAKDSKAPALVRAWASQAEVAGKSTEKVAEARACADAMEEWHKAHPAKECPLYGKCPTFLEHGQCLDWGQCSEALPDE